MWKPHFSKSTIFTAALCQSSLAVPQAPDWIRNAPSSQSGQVTLAWSSVAGATSYQVKRGTSPTSALTTIGSVTTESFTDNTASAGVRYYYTVTAIDGTGESPPTRGILASPCTIVDNGGPGASSTGSWTGSVLEGSFGSPSVFASPIAGATPSATYTFTPDLPVRGNHDVYLRWTADPNRATNTPVDIVFPDGSRTITINQELNHASWVLLTNVTAEAGTTTSITIRNNNANGYVVADAVQFIPRASPLAEDEENLSEYTLVTLDEHFDGTSLDTAKWSTFLGRGEHSVSNGRLHTKLRYKGAVPIGSATTADFENEANWAEGGIVADHATKFGYHEARLRLPQIPARGVDIAYWHGATDELLTGYEIDAPEFFNKDADGSSNNYGFGVWDHIDGDRTWDYHANYSTLGDIAQYVTIGLEWRTDNTQVVYVNGAKVYTAPTSGMNDTESILPSNIILSTKVLDWMHPNAALDGTEATWDYARFYQKPGFLGALDGDWSKPGNWGPDGLPSAGYAAVFNMESAPAAITLGSDQTMQSIVLDGATLPAHTFGGSGALRLGAGKAGDNSATHGGILVNTTVANNQTVNCPIVAIRNLQFANLSRTSGTTLALNGTIAGDGVAPRDVDFVAPLATNPGLGAITLAQPLGSGIRHINRAGDCILHLPANNQHTGELRIARGPVSINSITALGSTANSAVVFRPRYKHSESWRPRLTYNGSGETSAHILKLGGWQADGILESIGNGPLIWTGDISIAPFAESPKQVLTRDISLTLAASTTSGANVFSGNLSDAGVQVTYLNSDNSPNTGPATLRINKSGSGTWSLLGNNDYSGTTTINGGTLSVNTINSVNGGSPSLASSGLGAPKTVENGTISITSGTLRYTGSGETTDRVIHLAGSSGATLEHNGSGLLEFTSNLLSSTSTKTLTLTGSGTGRISGVIPNNSPSNKTNLSKTGNGTWVLNGNNTYTGTTTISSGTLVVDGSIDNGGTLTVSTSAGKLTGIGTIATPSVINGTLTTASLTFTNSLTVGSFGKLLAEFSTNNANQIQSITGSSVTINSGAKVDVTLNAPGSTTNFLQSWWRSPRVIPLLTANAKSGTFTIGTVTPDSAGNEAAIYGTFSLQQTPTSVNLVWTPLPGFPDIDIPTISLITPSANPISIQDAQTDLRAAVSAGGNSAVQWSQTSGPAPATFSHPDASDTHITFPTIGSYIIQAIASNALGSASTHFTVHVAPPTTMTFRQGENAYSQQTTFIRGDSISWNSGSRDQFLVGRTNAPFRGLMSFDLSTVPAGSQITSASLDLRSAGLGVGSMLNTLHLHQLLVPFIEGTGDGNTAANGTGSGADWIFRDSGIPWSSPGVADGVDYTSTPLSSLAGYNPSTFTAGTPIGFTSTASFVQAAADAILEAQPLHLLFRMDADHIGASLYTRIASDDHSNINHRPRLSLTLEHDFAPTVDTGQIPSPSPTPGATVALQGIVSNATSSVWTNPEGPAQAVFADPSAPSTNVVFPQPGVYHLMLSAVNLHGETSRNLTVTILSRFDAWRELHFGNTSNSGEAADSSDPDHDGITNLMEFATGNLPKNSDGSITQLILLQESMEFTYRRSHEAMADGIQFVVEWSTSLDGDWTVDGVTQSSVAGSDNGSSTAWKANVPLGIEKRFVRLKVLAPDGAES